MDDDQEGTYAPQSPDFSAYQSTFPPESSSNAYYPPNQHQQQQQHQPPYTPPGPHFFGASAPLQPSNPYQSSTMPRNGKKQGHDNNGNPDWAPETSTQGSRKSKKQKIEARCDKPAPGEKEGIEVKTKFPVARIKRIMQADEDVGKVAQVTPTAVSKALELFMISLVTKAADEARAKSSKRVTAAHLKQACERDEQWDFLASIMAKVPDAPTAKKDEDSEETGEGKKKKVTTRRKKKEPDDS